MLAPNHVFTLLVMENDRSPVALVTGFTNRSLQIIIKFFSNIIGGVEAPPQPPQLRGPYLSHKGIFNGYQNIDAKKIKFAHLWYTPLEPL